MKKEKHRKTEKKFIQQMPAKNREEKKIYILVILFLLMVKGGATSRGWE